MICATLAFSLASSSAGLDADTVEFVDGNRAENVRVLLYGGRVNLIFEGGAIQVYREEQIARIANSPVSWTTGMDEAHFEREARLRIFKLQSEIRERERARIEREAAERRYGLYLSLAFPGLGQFARGSPIRGSIYGGLAIGLGGAIVNANEQRQEALLAYEDVGLPLLNVYVNARNGGFFTYVVQNVYFRERFAAFREARDTYDRLWLGLILLWAWNAVDAYFFQSPQEYRPEAVSQGSIAADLRKGWPEFSLSRERAVLRWSFAL